MLLQIRRIIPHGMFNGSERRHSRLDLKALNNFGDDNRQEKFTVLSAWSHLFMQLPLLGSSPTPNFTQ